MRVDNNIGKKFNRLTVIEVDMIYSIKAKRNRKHYICECECGSIKSIRYLNVIKGSVISCGCYNDEVRRRNKVKDPEIGFKFNHLTVVERMPDDIRQSGHKSFRCRCDCGNEVIIGKPFIIMERNKHCGIKGCPYNPNRIGEEELIRRKKEYKTKRKERRDWSNRIYQKYDYTCDICSRRAGK